MLEDIREQLSKDVIVMVGLNDEGGDDNPWESNDRLKPTISIMQGPKLDIQQ
jgi:hypothetical protein